MACTADSLIQVFNQAFAESESTLLVKGGDEPVYYPAGCAQNPGSFHQILFAHGYVNSALHEVAHWCIAGRERRKLVDYGYWYHPDGRSSSQQRCFEKVEIKPQALEWHFAKACGVGFRVSLDNLNNPHQHLLMDSSAKFKQAVSDQAISYVQKGLPERAALFKKICAEAFGSYAVPDGEAKSGDPTLTGKVVGTDFCVSQL